MSLVLTMMLLAHSPSLTLATNEEVVPVTTATLVGKGLTDLGAEARATLNTLPTWVRVSVGVFAGLFLQAAGSSVFDITERTDVHSFVDHALATRDRTGGFVLGEF